jgi:hypothetical protein
MAAADAGVSRNKWVVGALMEAAAARGHGGRGEPGTPHELGHETLSRRPPKPRLTPLRTGTRSEMVKRLDELRRVAGS